MNFIKDYLKVISYMLIGVVFSVSSFYLFINIFHSLEINREYVVNVGETELVKNYYERIANIQANVQNFNYRTYTGTVDSTKMLTIQQNFKQCANILSDTYLEELKDKQSIDIVDVYKLRDSYENRILSDCIINNLYWTLSLTENKINSATLKNNQELLNLYVNRLKGATSYLKKDLLNNSSYYFNTSTASSGVKDNVRDGFYETLDAYKNASLYVEYLSEWFKNEAGGV